MFDQNWIDRFWLNVDKSCGPDGCWFYIPPYLKDVPGHRDPHSTTVVKTGAKRMGIHQFAYELTYGPLSEGHVVRHRCAVGGCCNPAHLLSGTHQQNSWDCAARKIAGIEPGVLATYEDIPDYEPPAVRRQKQGTMKTIDLLRAVLRRAKKEGMDRTQAYVLVDSVFGR